MHFVIRFWYCFYQILTCLFVWHNWNHDSLNHITFLILIIFQLYTIQSLFVLLKEFEIFYLVNYRQQRPLTSILDTFTWWIVHSETIWENSWLRPSAMFCIITPLLSFISQETPSHSPVGDDTKIYIETQFLPDNWVFKHLTAATLKHFTNATVFVKNLRMFK